MGAFYFPRKLPLTRFNLTVILGFVIELNKHTGESEMAKLDSYTVLDLVEKGIQVTLTYVSEEGLDMKVVIEETDTEKEYQVEVTYNVHGCREPVAETVDRGQALWYIRRALFFGTNVNVSIW